MVGITTIDNGDVVKVEFRLTGIIEGCKVCQDYLHKHPEILANSTLARLASFKALICHARTHHFHSFGLLDLCM